MNHFSLLIISGIFLVLLVFTNMRRSKLLTVSIMQSLLRPSQIVLAYMLVFLFLGSILFHYQKVYNFDYYIDASYWRVWPIVFLTILIPISILLSNTVKFGPSVSNFSNSKANAHYPWEIPAFFMALAASVSGITIFLLFSTALYIAGAANSRARSPFYITFFLAGGALLLPTASDGKRLLIFPLIIVLMMIWRDDVIRSRSFILIFSGSVMAIIPLSIMRGYGQFDVDNFIDAVGYAGAYISSDHFMAVFGNNIEATYFYFHGINSLQITFQSGNYLWGETLLNMLFLGSNAYGFEDGLRSSIEVYTTEYDPNLRAIGGSYPVMLVSEFAMNFGVFSILLFPLFLLLLDSIWRKIRTLHNTTIRFSLEAVMLYASLLLARGASFDLFLYNLIVLSAPIVTLVWIVSKIRLRRVTAAS